MEHDIERMPQDIGLVKRANQAIFAMAKRVLKAQKLKK